MIKISPPTDTPGLLLWMLCMCVAPSTHRRMMVRQNGRSFHLAASMVVAAACCVDVVRSFVVPVSTPLSSRAHVAASSPIACSEARAQQVGNSLPSWTLSTTAELMIDVQLLGTAATIWYSLSPFPSRAESREPAGCSKFQRRVVDVSGL